MTPSVVIVGAGPVGLVHALGLAQAGVKVTALEAPSEPRPMPGDLVYQWNVLPSLELLGVLDDLHAVGFAEPRSFYRIGSTGETLTFDLDVLSGETSHPYNLYVRQAEVTRVLLDHLAQYAQARVLTNCSVVGLAQDGSGVDVACDGPSGLVSLRAEWLVGADGSRSVVRRRLGLAFSGITWPERLVSVDLVTDLEPLGMHGAGCIIDPNIGSVLTCIEPGRRWRYVYAEDRASAEGSLAKRMTSVLAAGLPTWDDNVSIESWSTYRIHQRSAETFRVGRILLIGDAAHLTNPVSGHGMTSGLFDAFALTQALSAVVLNGVDDSILDRLAEQRLRTFLEHASPNSAERKKLVFNLEDDFAVEQEIKPFRRISSDPDRMREWLLLARGLESPILA